MKIEEMTSYRLVEKKKIEDLNSMSYLLEHKKSGARIALLSNDDENKVFYIVFVRRRRTVRELPIFWSILCWKGAGIFR